MDPGRTRGCRVRQRAVELERGGEEVLEHLRVDRLEDALTLLEAGEDTAQNYGEMYATIAAGSERAKTENMAYGAPEGAMGLTAYSFVIDGENGEGGRNVARGVAGLAILGAGAGAFALRRRFV